MPRVDEVAEEDREGACGRVGTSGRSSKPYDAAVVRREYAGGRRAWCCCCCDDEDEVDACEVLLPWLLGNCTCDREGEVGPAEEACREGVCLG